MQFIDIARFMASSLSNLVNNPAEEINKTIFKYGNYNKKCKTCRIKYKDYQCNFEYTSVIDDLIEYKYYMLQ